MKGSLIVAGAVLVLIAATVFLGPPFYRAAPEITVSTTASRIARGEYLANHVLVCFECHTKRDHHKLGSPPAGPTGAGGTCWGERENVSGTVCMSNITPDVETGIGGWTDGEILRAVREGVDQGGRALFPIMPYQSYRHLSDADGKALVAYLRTLPAVKNDVPEPDIGFLEGLATRFEPQPLDGPVRGVAPTASVAYGKYLARIAGCITCHTPLDDQGQPVDGMELAGGQAFAGPWGVAVSSNLTRHATGWADRTKQNWVGRFQAFRGLEAVPVSPEANTPMPWVAFSNMNRRDLLCLAEYVMLQKPIDNAVEKRPHLGGVEPLEHPLDGG